MSMNFLEYYRENLMHLRSLGSEFAAEFPKIAARLELSSLDCQDPYVERIIEGTAFLAARVDKKLDDGFPRMLESILCSISPHALYPVPSAGILELKPDFSEATLKTGAIISKEDKFEAKVSFTETPCIYRPVWNTLLYPLSLASSQYITRELESYCPVGKNDTAALVVKLETESGVNMSDIQLSVLDLFINMSENNTSELIQQLIVDLTNVYIRYNGNVIKAEGIKLSIPAIDGSLSFSSADRLNGLGILQEFIAHPQFFKFIRISGLSEVFKQVNATDAELIFTFRKRVTGFTTIISDESLKLWCVPVANIFKKRTNRGRADMGYEYHIVPERTATLEYEVYSVEKADFYNESNELLFSAKPFYLTGSEIDENSTRDYFSVHRRNRIVAKETIQRSSYLVADAFLSVSGDNWKQFRDDITQVATDTMCTNGILPIFLRMGTTILPIGIKSVSSVSFLGAPSRPAKAPISDGSKSSWEKLAHIMLNLSSVFWQPGDIPVHILKRMISHYSTLSQEETDRLTDGILSVETEPETFRFIYKNCNVYFEKGWRVTITLSEKKFEGTGFFLFACVLRKLLDSFTPINSHVEVVLYTEEKGYITKWMTSKG